MTQEDKRKDEEEASKLNEEKKKQRTYYSFTNTSVSLEASTPVEPEEGMFYKGLLSSVYTIQFCRIKITSDGRFEVCQIAMYMGIKSTKVTVRNR